ncbi:MAG: V-type ATP synthase subunit F [Thiogranum sp.]|jgi:vacuolar-type H+-ATPase subunit F/Vma7
MFQPVFIGDEVNAAGFQLAGLRVRTPSAGKLPEVIRWACENAPLVLISADMAQRLPAAELDRLLAGVTPPVVVVPDVHNATPMPDLATRLRQQLGVLE